MYRELIKRLRSESALPYGAIKDMREAADAIESIGKAYQMISEAYEAEVTKQNWIPVEKRLPVKKNRTYWICTDTGYQCECRWTNNMFGIGELDEWGWNIADVPQYHKVVAWMFLPEPYEPLKEE